MKKSMLVVVVVMSLALFSLPGNAQTGPNVIRSLVLTNELGPGVSSDLIERLIAAGCGNLYQSLQFLAAQPGSGIPADFVAEVGSSPAGSEVFTASLNDFVSGNNPVGINADGTFIRADFDVQDYDGHPGFTTNTVPYAGVGPVQFTMAIAPANYIYMGSDGGEPEHDYYAIGIVWVGAAGPVSVPTLNEWGMILLSLALAGAGLVYMKRRRRLAD